MQVRKAFPTRKQSEKEDWMQYLDTLEGLRSQGFPDELVAFKRYEILQRFIEGVRDTTLRRELSITYASETTVTDPLTVVESLRFTTRQLQRNRPKPSQPYDPRHALRSRPHPFVPLAPNKMVLPQGVLPPPPPSNAPANPAAEPPAIRVPLGVCFICAQICHFARNCPTRDQPRKPTVVPEPEAVKTTTVDVVECIAENCSGVRFCVNCGQIDHVASQCVENPVCDDLAYSR